MSVTDIADSFDRVIDALQERANFYATSTRAENQQKAELLDAIAHVLREEVRTLRTGVKRNA